MRGDSVGGVSELVIFGMQLLSGRDGVSVGAAGAAEGGRWPEGRMGLSGCGMQRRECWTGCRWGGQRVTLASSSEGRTASIWSLTTGNSDF